MSDTESVVVSRPAAVGPALRWLRRAGADRAAVLGLVSRAWMLVASPVTIVLMARAVSPEVQGFYYTFASLVALQAFVELGLHLVIVNVASHEWAALGLDRAGAIVGDGAALSRLVSLGRLVFRWYAAASGVFVVAVSAAGYVFFSGMPDPGVDWRPPWFVLVALTGGLLWALPFVSMLEGCGQVAEVYRFRLTQAVVGNLALWLTLGLGGGLWASAVWAGVGLARDLYLLLVRYRRFFAPFFRPPTGSRVSWRAEVWPMQWRLAVSGAVNYLAFSLFTPVIFRYQGAAEAGRMGMSWAAILGIQSVATVVMQVQAPGFGVLVARRQFAELDRKFAHVARFALGLFAAGAGSLWLAIVGLNAVGHPLAGRLLPPLPTGLFLVAVGLVLASFSLGVYLRAHKKEPLALVSVVSNLSSGAVVWLLGSRYGATGAAVGFLGVSVLTFVVICWIFLDCRSRWHVG